MTKVALLVALATLLHARVAAACASCGCGDPTLTALGTEKPFAQRLRIALEVRQRDDAVGATNVDQLRLREQRSELAIAFAPLDRLMLMAALPAVRRTVDYVNDARAVNLGVGDLELRAKGFVYQDRAFAARHLVAVSLGVKVPTASTARAANDQALPSELQPGTDSVDPGLGLSYAWFGPPWSAYLGAYAILTRQAAPGTRASRTVRSSLFLQRQWSALALRLGADTRVDGRALERGEPEPDSGGFVLFAGPDVVLSPLTDLVVSAGVRLPVVQALHGHHDEGPVLSVALAYDL